MYEDPQYKFELYTQLKNEKKEKEKKDIRRVAGFTGLAFLIMLFLPQVVNIISVNVALLFGVCDEYVAFISDPFGLQIFQIIYSLMVFILPFTVISAGCNKKVRNTVSFKLPEKESFLPLFLMAIGFCAFANITTNIIGNIYASFGINFTAPENPLPQGALGIVISLLSTAIVPALTEEFALRGEVMGSAKCMGDGYAIVFSAILFGIMHGNFVQMPFAFVMGLAIGFAVIKTGSLWTGILIHFVNNAVSVILDYAFSAISSAELQNAVMCIYFALCFVCFFIGLLLSRKNKGIWQLENVKSECTLSEKAIAYFTSPPLLIAIVIFCVQSYEYVVF